MKVDDDQIKALNRALDENLLPDWDEQLGAFKFISKSTGGTYLVKDGHCTCTGYARWSMCKHVALANYMLWLSKRALVCECCGEIIYMNKARPVQDEPYPFITVV